LSDIGLHWSALELALAALIVASPGIVAGLVLGAVAWRSHRGRGAALGSFAGGALALALLAICFGTPIAQADGLSDAAWKALTICWPGLALGGALAAWRFRSRGIVAALCGAPVGAVVWLGGWAAFN